MRMGRSLRAKWFSRPAPPIDCTAQYLYLLNDLSFNKAKCELKPDGVRHGCRPSAYRQGHQELSVITWLWSYLGAKIELRLDLVADLLFVAIEWAPIAGVGTDRETRSYSLLSREDFEEFRKWFPIAIKMVRSNAEDLAADETAIDSNGHA